MTRRSTLLAQRAWTTSLRRSFRLFRCSLGAQLHQAYKSSADNVFEGFFALSPISKKVRSPAASAEMTLQVKMSTLSAHQMAPVRVVAHSSSWTPAAYELEESSPPSPVLSLLDSARDRTSWPLHATPSDKVQKFVRDAFCRVPKNACGRRI